jgi:hypothetical protein
MYNGRCYRYRAIKNFHCSSQKLLYNYCTPYSLPRFEPGRQIRSFEELYDRRFNSGPSVTCVVFSRGLVPLHNACSYGHYEVTELLVRAGADVNATDLWAFTPLHEAASKARLEVRENYSIDFMLCFHHVVIKIRHLFLRPTA